MEVDSDSVPEECGGEGLFLLTIVDEGQEGFTDKVLSQMGLEGLVELCWKKGEWMTFISGIGPGHKGVQCRGCRESTCQLSQTVEWEYQGIGMDDSDRDYKDKLR